jgi:hypothetical protein
LEYDALPPAWLVAATAMTPAQLAGELVVASVFELPAATMTVAPRARAALIAFCDVMPQSPPPPSERLITWAGCVFCGTPLTVPPAAQTMASATSEV